MTGTVHLTSQFLEHTISGSVIYQLSDIGMDDQKPKVKSGV